jgi:hypothetical protein
MPPHLRRLQRSDLFLLLVALGAAALFFSSLGRLWPLADFDLHLPRDQVVEAAREALADRGSDVTGHSAATLVRVDAPALDFLQRAVGREGAQRLIAQGAPIYRYEAYFKQAGDPDSAWAQWHPAAGLLAWGVGVQEDAPGALLEGAEARHLVGEALAPLFGLDPGGWEERGVADRLRPQRRDHTFVYERILREEPEIRERVTVSVAGDLVHRVDRVLVVPEEARRHTRAREAPVTALQYTGFALVAVMALGAFVVFLTRLRAGAVRLLPAASVVALVGACFLITQLLEPARLLLAWDPLWPRWVSGFQTLMLAAAGGAWILLVLFVVIAAGDAVDRELGARRGDSLWLAARGHLAHPAVALASARGFLVGLLCGGALTLTALALEAAAGAWPPLQPQGFFFFALNSSVPALSTLLYFLMVALVEETGYRFFGASWLYSVTRLRWLAILVPAALYGITHTGLTFIPPAEPFWGRALAFTAVGAVWGWAFLRYDALTVVLSHWAADLFIFNWPRIASGDPLLIAKGVATLAVPLVPALLWLLARPLRGPTSQAEATSGGREPRSG